MKKGKEIKHENKFDDELSSQHDNSKGFLGLQDSESEISISRVWRPPTRAKRPKIQKLFVVNRLQEVECTAQMDEEIDLP